MRWHTTVSCIEFVLDLRRVNRPSLARVVEKLYLSAVKDSRLYKTFGHAVTEMFLLRETREPVSLSFTLSLPGQQRCVYNSSKSMTKGKTGLFLTVFTFSQGTRPNLCKCLSISLDQFNLHSKV